MSPNSDQNIEYETHLLSKERKLLGNAIIDYCAVTLSDEPWLRMPCYNIPLQCLNRMAFEDIGLETWDTSEMLQHLKKNKTDVIKFGRTNPDMEVWEAMFYWTHFEIRGLTLDERVGWLRRKNPYKDGERETKHKVALKKKIQRYFKKHLAES